MFEAVGGGALVPLAVLLPLLAEEQRVLVQEQVALHGLEARQVLHACGALLVADPHVEGALHDDTTQVTQLALGRRRRETGKNVSLASSSTVVISSDPPVKYCTW